MVFSNDRLMRYVICLLWLVSCHQFLKLCYFPFVHWLYLNNVFIMLNFVSLFSIDSLISFWLERNYHREADADFSKVTFTAYLPSFLETFYKNLSSTVSLSIIPSDSNDQHLCNSSLIDSSLLKATLQEMLHLSYFYVFLSKLVQIRYISTWFLMELSFVSYRVSYYNIPVMT